MENKSEEKENSLKTVYEKPQVQFVPLKPEEKLLACCKFGTNHVDSCADCMGGTFNTSAS